MARIEIEVPDEDAESFINPDEPDYSLDDDFLISIAALEAFVEGNDTLVNKIEEEVGTETMSQAYLQSSLVLLDLLSKATEITAKDLLMSIREYHLNKNN